MYVTVFQHDQYCTRICCQIKEKQQGNKWNVLKREILFFTFSSVTFTILIGALGTDSLQVHRCEVETLLSENIAKSLHYYGICT